MSIAPEDRPRVRWECMRMVATLKLDPAKSKLIGAFIANYLNLTSAETAVYNRLLESMEPNERKAVMQLTNPWVEEGRQEARRLVDRQLRRKLGKLPARLERAIGLLDDASVFALGDALLDFTTTADAQRWLAQRKQVKAR